MRIVNRLYRGGVPVIIPPNAKKEKTMYYLAYTPDYITIAQDSTEHPFESAVGTVLRFASPTDLAQLDDATLRRCLLALNFEPEDALPANVHDIIFELTEQAELPVSSITSSQAPAAEPPGQEHAQGLVYDIDSTDAVVRISTGMEQLPDSKRFTAADATDLDAMGSDLMLRCFFALGQKLNVLPPMASDVMFDLLGKAELPASMSVQDWPLAKPDKSPKKSKKDLTVPSDETIQSPPGSDVAPEEKETTMTKDEIKAKKAADKIKTDEAKAAKKAKDKEKADKLKAREDKAKQKAKDDAAKLKAREDKTAAKAKADEKKAKAKDGTKTPRGEKTLTVKKLLERKSGCTRKDILEATGWPAVSVQAMAKSCGLKLRQEKEKGKTTVYFGS